MAVKTLAQEKVERKPYDHARLESRRRFLRFLLRHIGFNFLAKLDRVEGLENVPASGPAILMINHIAFIDSLVVMHIMPRNIVPLAKAEVYDYPLVGLIPRLWHVIPVHRDEFDRRAVQQVLEVLKAGEIVLVAPEGTRHTALEAGKEGVAYLASRSGVPIIPVAVEGTPGFPALRFFSRMWHTPGAHVKVGRPFRFKPELQRPSREQLHQMTTEAMYILAQMLPEERRGVYSDISKATTETLELV